LHQGVLECIDRIGRRTLLKRQSRFDELRRRLIQLKLRMRRDGGNKLI
jgi:hypothetical protein